jgi:predicted small secreted protein
LGELRDFPCRLKGEEAYKMKMRVIALVAAVLAAAVLLTATTASAASGNTGFGFNATGIGGFPTGAASLTGGGSYNPASGFVKSAGGFRCTTDVGQGPLAGCLTGQGVRWDTVELRASTTFKCTGSAAEALKTAVTDENTVVLLADFYRAGDGVDESFTAQMIVSADDIAADVAGIENVWIQGVGCAPGVANFSS